MHKVSIKHDFLSNNAFSDETVSFIINCQLSQCVDMEPGLNSCQGQSKGYCVLCLLCDKVHGPFFFMEDHYKHRIP